MPAVRTGEGRSFVTTREAAEILEVSMPTVRDWIYKGVLPAYQVVDNGDWRIDKDEFQQFVNERYGLS